MIQKQDKIKRHEPDTISNACQTQPEITVSTLIQFPLLNC